MASLGKYLRTIEGDRLGFWCPGCEEMHVVTSNWKWNNNTEQPTFSPSILVKSGHYASTNPDECWCTFKGDKGSFECSLCHSFVIDGNIQFLGDCTHKLKNQTVPMVEIHAQ